MMTGRVRGHRFGPELRARGSITDNQESTSVFKANTTLLLELLIIAGFCAAVLLCISLTKPDEATAADPPKKRLRQVTQKSSPGKNPAPALSTPQKKDRPRATKTPAQQQTSTTKALAPTTKHEARSTKHETRYSYHGVFVEGLKSAPFPLTGKDFDPNFFDYVDPRTGERFRTTRTLERLPEKDHYRDNGVLFLIPSHFNPSKPFAYVVFFHGNRTEVRQAMKEYRLDDQINRSGKNVILVLPPLAKNASDSSPGKFARKHAFRAFMQEAAQVLSPRFGKKYQQHLERAPIILAAFSGGYKPLACTLDRGGTDSRIRGILLLDGLYEDLYIFGRWLLQRSNSSFFINIYTDGSACHDKTTVLAQFLRTHRIAYKEVWPKGIGRGQIVFVRSPREHLEVPVEGPPREPLAELLRSLKEF